MNAEYWTFERIRREPERALRSMDHDPLESEIRWLPEPDPESRDEIRRLVRLHTLHGMWQRILRGARRMAGR